MKNGHKLLFLGALLGAAAFYINREMRAVARGIPEAQPDVKGRASIDDVPTLQPEVRQLDDSVGSGTPF